MPQSEAASEDSIAVIVKPHVHKKPKTSMQWAAGVVALFHHDHHHHGHEASAEAATAAGGEGTKKEPKTWCTVRQNLLHTKLDGRRR